MALSDLGISESDRANAIGEIRSVLREGFRLPLYGMALMTALGATLESVMPLAFRHVVDRLALVAQGGVMDYSWFFVLVGLGAGALIAFRAQQVIDVYVGPRLAARIQKRQLDRLLNASPAFMARASSGSIVQAVKGCAMACLGLVQLATFDFVNIMVVIVTVGTVLCIANVVYGLIVFGWLVVYVVGVGYMAHRCFSLGYQRFLATGASAGEIGDTLLNFETVFNFGRFDYERNRVGASIDIEAERGRQLRIYVLIMRTFAAVAAFALLLLMSTLALRDVLAGRQTIGMFVLAFSATNVLVMTVFDLSRQLLSFYENVGILHGALATIASIPILEKRNPDAPVLPRASGRIEYRDVYFRYPGKSLLFEGFNLSIAAGEKVGLVGPSGAGKTTLMRLLLNQLPVESGSVAIDEQDISTLSLIELQQQLATVSQVSSLFNRSFRDNIAYGRPDAPESEIIQAGRSANLHETITRRDGAYENMVGQGGSEISGGERQRLSIARAILKSEASILLLDEATSALDSETERDIQQMLGTIFGDRTVLAIAHRLSTLLQMDRIVFIDNGAIVEQGTHESLLSSGGRYAQLWGLQEGQQFLRVFADDAADETTSIDTRESVTM